jgi:hypothetical protein
VRVARALLPIPASAGPFFFCCCARPRADASPGCAVEEVGLLSQEVRRQTWLEGACRALKEAPTLPHLQHLVQEGERSAPRTTPIAPQRLPPTLLPAPLLVLAVPQHSPCCPPLLLVLPPPASLIACLCGVLQRGWWRPRPVPAGGPGFVGG